MFTNLRRRKKLKAEVYLEFQKSIEDKDWKKAAILGERYLKLQKKVKN